MNTILSDGIDNINGVLAATVELLRERGFAVCKPDPVEKKPTYSEWGRRSLEPSDFAPRDQVGILAGPLSNGNHPDHALIIIDLDDPKALELADDYLPPTEMVEGRPGKPRSHQYYLVPVDTIPEWAWSHAAQASQAALKETGHPGPFKKQFRDRETNACVLDLIGTGGQVVCPPSVHHSGEQREWEGGAPGEPAVVHFEKLWRKACLLADTCGCKPPSGLDWPWKKAVATNNAVSSHEASQPPASITQTDDDVIQRAIRYLEACAPAVSGQGGHDQTFAVACALVHGFALPAETALDLLRQHYNPQCVPPWTDKELRHKVEEVDRVNTHDQPRGHLRDNTPRKGTDAPLNKTSGQLSGTNPKPKSIADVLTGIGLAQDLWHDSTERAFVTIDRVSHPIRGKRFRSFLINQFRQKHDGKVPNPDAINTARDAIEAAAIHDGPEYPIYVRIAEHGGTVYLFLADQDSTVIEIDADGWRVCDYPPVRFRKPAGMLPLPMPQPGGNIYDLRQFLNVPDDGAFALLLAWLTAALCPKGPFPLLVLLGEQGTAKSTTARVLKLLLDPNKADIRSEPKEVRDLMIQARNGWILAFDNISHVPPWFSDALCRLATGGGFSTRVLYTDDDEMIFDSKRPLVLNGIGDIITRADLLERALLIVHPSIPEGRRRPESEFWTEFNAAHPVLLGALLDRVSAGLRALHSVKLDRHPRMADFAKIAIACERGTGEEARFWSAYDQNQADGRVQSLESTPVVATLIAFMENRPDSWTGTATELLAALTSELPIRGNGHDRPYGWPRRPNELGNLLKRLAPSLRHVHGLDVTPVRTKQSRMIRITRLPENVRDSSSPLSPSSPTMKSNGSSGDDELIPLPDSSSPRRHQSNSETPENTAISQPGDDGDNGDDVSRTFSGSDSEPTNDYSAADVMAWESARERERCEFPVDGL